MATNDAIILKTYIIFRNEQGFFITDRQKAKMHKNTLCIIFTHFSLNSPTAQSPDESGFVR
jgi:hypothetical protein